MRTHVGALWNAVGMWRFVIPVSFGPHVADWWMVAVTALSVIVSGVLAWLAYRNGREATTIASEASARDEAHLRRETERRAQAERAEVAMAMMRAVAATEAYRQVKKSSGTYVTTESDVKSEMYLRWSEALAHVDLYATAEEDDELHVWVEGALSALAELKLTGVDALHAIGVAHDTRRGIVLWNARAVTSNQLAVGDLPDDAGVRTA